MYVCMIMDLSNQFPNKKYVFGTLSPFILKALIRLNPFCQ